MAETHIVFDMAHCEIIRREPGKRGAEMIIARHPVRGEIKVNAKYAEYPMQFSEPRPLTNADLRGMKDFYGDVRRMSARW